MANHKPDMTVVSPVQYKAYNKLLKPTLKSGLLKNLGVTTQSAKGTPLTQKGLEDAYKALIEDDENSSFFIKNLKLAVNEDDWPSQRKYIKFLLAQINSALFNTRQKIGKCIQIQIRGEKDDKVLEHDHAKLQALLIDVQELSGKEIRDIIMMKLKQVKVK